MVQNTQGNLINSYICIPINLPQESRVHGFQVMRVLPISIMNMASENTIHNSVILSSAFICCQLISPIPYGLVSVCTQCIGLCN